MIWKKNVIKKNSFIYPDEILNYYFIIKGKSNDQNIQINFESFKKSEQYVFSSDKITKENDGDIIGQIIIGNILKNDDKIDENLEIKLSKNYQILSKKTSLFVVGEGNEENKIAEFKQVKKKKKPEYNFSKNLFLNSSSPYRIERERAHNININLGCSRPIRYDRAERAERECFSGNMDCDMDEENDNKDEEENDYMMCDIKCCKESAPIMREGLACCMDEGDDDEDMFYGNSSKNENIPKECFVPIENNCKMNAKEFECEESKKESVEKVEFSNKELVLTQDIFDGFWKINPQTNLLIEKEKAAYENIEKIIKEKNLDKEEIKVTLLVLYYLNTDSSINKIEYSLIIKKGVSFLEKNGINFDEILPMIKI